MPDQSRQYATMRASLRLVAAIGSGRVRAAEKIMLTAPNIGELAYGLARLVLIVLRSHHIDPTTFVESGLADITQQERADAAQRDQVTG